jgi:hypothetical protein
MMEVITIRRVFLLMLSMAGILLSQRFIVRRPEWRGGLAPEGIVVSLDAEISIPHMPKVGELFEVTLIVYCKENFESARFGPDYIATFNSDGAEIIEGNEKEFHGYMQKGDIKQFTAKMIIRKPHKSVSIHGGLLSPNWPGPQGVGFTIHLIDSITGQYGPKEEWEQKVIGVFARYNPLGPQWFRKPDLRWVTMNRKIAAEMKEFEPALTDSEALCLHQDNYLLIINAIGDTFATDSERIEHLLKAGWLDAQHAGAEVKEEWFNDFMEKNRGRWKR